MIKFVKAITIALKTGTVTTKYPHEKPLVADSFRGAIEIDPAKCIGCGACTWACPPKALSLTMESEKAVLRYFVGRCIFCGICIDTCPEKAIRITRRFELASNSPTDLYSDIEYDVKICSMCGKPYATAKLVNTVQKTVPSLTDKTHDLCPECRRREIAAKLLNYRR